MPFKKHDYFASVDIAYSSLKRSKGKIQKVFLYFGDFFYHSSYFGNMIYLLVRYKKILNQNLNIVYLKFREFQSNLSTLYMCVCV